MVKHPHPYTHTHIHIKKTDTHRHQKKNKKLDFVGLSSLDKKGWHSKSIRQLCDKIWAEPCLPLACLLGHAWTWMILSSQDHQRPPVKLLNRDQHPPAKDAGTNLHSLLSSASLLSGGFGLRLCHCSLICHATHRTLWVSLSHLLAYHWFWFINFLLSFRLEYLLWLWGPSDSVLHWEKGFFGCFLLN